MKKRFTTGIVASVLSLGILGTGLSTMIYANIKNESNHVARASAIPERVMNAAVNAISQHDKVGKKDIKIVNVKTIRNGEWFILYKVKERAGSWIPTDGNFGVVVDETSNGQLHEYFPRY